MKRNQIINYNNDLFQINKILDLNEKFFKFEDILKKYYQSDSILNSDNRYILLCSKIVEPQIIKEIISGRLKIIELIDNYNISEKLGEKSIDLNELVLKIKEHFETPVLKINTLILKKEIKKYLERINGKI